MTVYLVRLAAGAALLTVLAGSSLSTRPRGEVFAVKAGPAYELVSTNRMGEPLMATPAISDGVIFIRGQQHLFAVK